jgi:hypothetical protein
VAGSSKTSIQTLKNTYREKALLWATPVILVWTFLWFWPWQSVLQDLLWVRLGIALAIFIAPGVALYGLLNDRQGHWADRLTFGLVLSHLLLALLGALGRLMHVSFDLIKTIMMGLGLILLLLYFLQVASRGITIPSRRASLQQIASAAPLLLITVLAGLVVIQRVLSDDDLTYLAFITNWQHAVRLGFADVIFGTGQIIQPRFWLVSTPFAQAFLADVSGLHGLLVLGGYYEPFLVCFSVLAGYGLARSFGLSHQAASVSAILQIVFLLLLSQYLHPGASFFSQLSADKATATFIVVPIVIQSEIWLLRSLTRKSVLLFFCTGLSLTLMHPIALAYSVFIGGLIIILNTDRSNFRTRLIPALVIFVILVPQMALRLVSAQSGETILETDVAGIQNQEGVQNMLAVWPGTPFYSFTPNILTMTFPYASRIPLPAGILEWGWLAIPIGAVIASLSQLRTSYMAQYMFSSFLLCLLAGLPLTGWMIGYFLSPWMLERTTWLFPYGLSTLFLLITLKDKACIGQAIRQVMETLEKKTSFSQWPLIVTTILSSALILLFMREHGLPDLTLFESKTQRYQDLARVGYFLDHQISDQAAVIGSDGLNNLIPGLSSKAKPVTFRTSSPANMPFYTLDVIDERIEDRKTILSRRAAPEERLELLKKYDVRFLLLRRSDYDLFKNLVSSDPSLFELTEIGRYILLRII